MRNNNEQKLPLMSKPQMDRNTLQENNGGEKMNENEKQQSTELKTVKQIKTTH